MSALYPPIPNQIRAFRIVFGIILATMALYAPFYFSAANNKLLSQALYLAIAAMGLNLLTGFNGQISIGHGFFFGVGAFTSAILVVDHSWPYEITIPLAGLVAGAVGLAIGFPALRVRGLHLALITLGLAVLFQPLTSKYIKGTGGVALLRPRSSQLESLFTFLDNDQWAYFVCLGATVLLFVAAWNLVRTRMGRAMVGCRDQELAATTLGVNLAATKVGTFALSAAYAGIAGSLSVMVDRVADGTTSNPVLYFQRSIEFLVAMVIGGSATILGPLVGAFLVVGLRQLIEENVEGREVLSPAVFGAALMLIVYIMPEGVVGGLGRLVRKFAFPPGGTDAST